MKRFLCLCLAALIALFGTFQTALANETVTYTYDALGRLVTVSSSGTVNNGQSVATSFDPAGNRTNYTISGAAAGTTYVSIGSATVTEGGTLAFPVTLSQTQATAVTVSYATSNGTATAGSDYTAASSTVTIPAGQTSAMISVVTIDDTAVESTETMTVTISSPTGGAVLGTASGTGTINDNDTPPANLAIGNASATEGGNLVFTVTRSGTTTTAVSVNYASASGTATSGSDFTATSGTLSFAANQTTGTITVPTIDDTATESTETMSITLSGASSGATITTATGTGTIADNDQATWSSTLTSGYFTDDCAWGCYLLHGYIPNWFGSMSNTTFGSYTIGGLYDSGGQIYLTMSGSTLPLNSGWTSITIPGVGTLTRASATYSGSGTSASWYWNNSSIVASGTVTIQ